MVDFRQLILSKIRLTKIVIGVDSHSFFDISNVFPVGGKSGIRAEGHRRTAQAGSEGGPARIYQQTAGRGEQEMRRGKNRSPEAFTDLPGWW